MKHFVVTIARQYYSLGLDIGKQLAQELGVNYYDKDLVSLPARELKKEEEDLDEVDESASRSFLSRREGIQDDLIEVQSRIIRVKAETESCVIIGRCADYVLQDRSDVMNVYIYAPFEARVNNLFTAKRTEGHLEQRLKTARDYSHFSDQLVKKVMEADKERGRYIRYVTGNRRSIYDNKHLMIDSSLLGIDGTVKLLKAAVQERFKD